MEPVVDSMEEGPPHYILPGPEQPQLLPDDPSLEAAAVQRSESRARPSSASTQRSVRPRLSESGSEPTPEPPVVITNISDDTPLSDLPRLLRGVPPSESGPPAPGSTMSSASSVPHDRWKAAEERSRCSGPYQGIESSSYIMTTCVLPQTYSSKEAALNATEKYATVQPS